MNPGEGSVSFVIVSFGIGGSALTAASVAAVLMACLGRPIPLASISVVPNLALAVSVPISAAFLTSSDAHFLTSLPALLWCVSCVLLAVVRTRQSVVAWREYGHQEDPELPASRRTHTLALLIGVVTSAVIPLFLVAGAAELAAGTAAVLFLVTRVTTSVIGLFVNALLLVRYNWNTRYTPSMRPLPGIIWMASLLAAWALIQPHRSGDVAGYAQVVAALTLMLIPSAIVLREANRRLLARVLLAKGIADLSLATLATVIFLHRPSVVGFLGVYMLSQSTTCFVCSLGLRHRATQIAGLASGVLALLLVVLGW